MKTFLLCPLLVGVAILLACPPDGRGQDKKTGSKKDAPRVLLALPLGVKVGTTTKVTIRGLKLDAATELRFPGTKATAKILSKAKAPPPDKMPPNRVGDTQFVAEVVVPADVSGPALPFVVLTPQGETPPHQLLLDTGRPVTPEKEPNEGFRQAMTIPLPQVVEGSISRPRDVDVFAFAGKAGQRVAFEVQAGRHGSPLDAVLTLYGPDGAQLLSTDAAEGKGDPRLEITLPRDGVYHLSLIDAHDQGGPLQVYRLAGRVVK
jgi:hypothetical protein